jgi:hypothetical protein
MPWEREHNIRSLSPHGIKAAEGHAMRGVHDLNCVPGPEQPPGAGVSSPYMPSSSRPPRDPRK